MKQSLLILSALIITTTLKAQVVAYPSVNNSKVFGASCADLHATNPVVIGHQLNVVVTYHETLADADTGTNSLNRFYTPLSDPQIIYARVESLLDASYATAECIVDTAPNPSGPPPGISSYYYDVCDVDNDGSEVVNLNNLKPLYEGYAFPTSTFCMSEDEEVTTTYYLTEIDATNETNLINPMYNLTGTQQFYRKIKNTTTGESLIDDMINVTVISCTTDTDMDGIPDLAEDANRNLFNQDGLKNYEDDDDDGDGILTVDEDYNGNGNPVDDDTNFNGVPDYLEANVTLSITEVNQTSLTIHPNPTSGIINITTTDTINSIEIYNHLGQLVVSQKTSDKVDITNLSPGLYMMSIKTSEGNTVIKKIVRK